MVITLNLLVYVNSMNGLLKKKQLQEVSYVILRPALINYRFVRGTLSGKARGEPLLFKLRCTFKISHGGTGTRTHNIAARSPRP
jgi:hypothetical protein